MDDLLLHWQVCPIISQLALYLLNHTAYEGQSGSKDRGDPEVRFKADRLIDC